MYSDSRNVTSVHCTYLNPMLLIYIYVLTVIFLQYFNWSVKMIVKSIFEVHTSILVQFPMTVDNDNDRLICISMFQRVHN